MSYDDSIKGSCFDPEELDDGQSCLRVSGTRRDRIGQAGAGDLIERPRRRQSFNSEVR